MGPFVFFCVVAVGAGSFARRYDRFDAFTCKQLAQLLGVEGLVANKRPASDAVHELFDKIDIMAVAGKQREAHEIAQGVDQSPDFRRRSAARAADGLILSPPFAPAPG